MASYSIIPLLAEITHSNQDRKLLQTFLTKSFLIDRHARFTGILSLSVLLASLFLNERPQAEVEGFKSGDCGCQKSLDQKLVLASKKFCTVFVVSAALRIIGRLNLIS